MRSLLVVLLLLIGSSTAFASSCEDIPISSIDDSTPIGGFIQNPAGVIYTVTGRTACITGSSSDWNTYSKMCDATTQGYVAIMYPYNDPVSCNTYSWKAQYNELDLNDCFDCEVKSNSTGQTSITSDSVCLAEVGPKPECLGCQVIYQWVTNTETGCAECRDVSGEEPSCGPALPGFLVSDLQCAGQQLPEGNYACTDSACHDQVKGENEIGVDCGGVCVASCVSKCPDGTDYEMTVGDENSNLPSMCIKEVLPNSLGQCPPGYTVIPATGPVWDPTTNIQIPGVSAICQSKIEAALVAAEVTSNAPSHPGDYSDYEESTETTTYEVFNLNNSPSPGQYNAPPGTESVMQTTSVTNHPDGTATSTNTYSFYSDPDGQGIKLGETSVTQTNSPGDGYVDTSLSGVNANTYDTSLTAPDKESIPALFNEFKEGSPFFSILNDTTIETDTAVCSFSTPPVYNRVITFDFCKWEDALKNIGSIFLVISHGAAVLIIYRGWK